MTRHRSDLVLTAARLLQEQQKVLNELNLKLPNVFSDLDGASAMAIEAAIVAGERSPSPLAKLWDPRRLQEQAAAMGMQLPPAASRGERVSQE